MIGRSKSDRAARRIALAAALIVPVWASAADILTAHYDGRYDDIVVEIAYRGTRPDHDFSVLWGACRNGAVTGRLVDEQGEDRAATAFRVEQRIDLNEIPCRPANVTLRLGRASHISVRVPAAPGAFSSDWEGGWYARKSP